MFFLYPCQKILVSLSYLRISFITGDDRTRNIFLIPEPEVLFFTLNQRKFETSNIPQVKQNDFPLKGIKIIKINQVYD